MEKDSAGDAINTTKDCHCHTYHGTSSHTHAHNRQLCINTSCSVMLYCVCACTDTLCSGGKDKVNCDCDTDVKELIVIDCIGDIWLFNFLLSLSQWLVKTCRRSDKRVWGLTTANEILQREKGESVDSKRKPSPPPCSSDSGRREDAHLGN